MSGTIAYGSNEYVDLVQAFEQEAEKRYINLPYHNYGHATHTRDVSLALGLKCIENGVDVNLLALEAAGLFHDADFHRDLPASIRSRELRSSRIAGRIMRQLEVPKETILCTQAAIRPTELGVKCTTPESKITCRADLDNPMHDYPSFLLNTYRLYKEQAYFNEGRLPPLGPFLLGSANVLIEYFSQDLRLGSFDSTSGFEQALANIHRLQNETTVSFLSRVTNRFTDQVAF